MWTILIALGWVVSMGLWVRQTWRLRLRWNRVERALNVLVNEGSRADAVAALGKDPELDVLQPLIVRLQSLHESLKQQIEYDEFSLRTVLSSMEEGVIVTDARQTIRLANPAFLSTFGLKRSPVDRSILEVLGEPDIHNLIKNALSSGESQERQVELVPFRRVRFVMTRAVPMSDAKGRPGVLVVFRDITRLMELEQVRREFVANVSHELRTPLAIFQGYVESLIEIPEMEDRERSEVYEILKKHSRRLNLLVEDLLSIARLEARREQFQWEMLEAGGLIQELVRDWKIRLGERDFQLDVSIEGELPAVRVDRIRIEQVLHNLLENALKHAPLQGGRVHVRARVEDSSRLKVSVEDNGSGISPMDLPHIFERFYRADKSRGSRTASAGSHGSGLGLSIVKHIVAAHGGEVGAESPSGSGALVWFSLPLPEQGRAQLSEPADSEAEKRLG